MYYIIIIIIIFFVIKYYLNYKKDYTIIQTFLKNIKSNDIFFEKYPIVIYDKIVDINEIMKSLFSYLYLTKKNKIYKKNKFIFNKSKFLIIYPENNTMIDIINPKYDISKNNFEYVTIQLKRKQISIMPFRWIVKPYDDLNCIELDDIITLFLGKFV